MLYSFKEMFQKKENVENSRIIELFEEVREALHYFNSTISLVTKDHEDLFYEDDSPLSLSLSKLSEINKKNESRLLYPQLTFSILGTMVSGKSTFINALLGNKLTPMDSEGSNVGLLKFKYNSNFSRKAKITINTLKPNKYWENGTYIETNENVYNRAFKIMNYYRKLSEKQSLSLPEIEIESAFLTGLKPQFLGLDHTVIEILDLPSLRTISDVENLRTIQDIVSSSFVIFVLDYSCFFDDAKKQHMFQELKEIVRSLGSIVTMLFVLNKVDLRNEDDKPLEEVIKKSQEEIKYNLNLPETPDVIPFDSLLLYSVNSAYLAYLHSENSNDLSKMDSYYKEKIIHYLNICLNQDSTRQIMRLSRENQSNRNLIREIEDNLEDGNIPEFSKFFEFWKLCSEKSGANLLYKKIRERTEYSLRELILFPTMHKFLYESDKFLNLLEQTIQTSKKESLEQIKDSRNKFNKFKDILTKFSSFEKNVMGISNRDNELEQKEKIIGNKFANSTNFFQEALNKKGVLNNLLHTKKTILVLRLTDERYIQTRKNAETGEMSFFENNFREFSKAIFAYWYGFSHDLPINLKEKFKLQNDNIESHKNLLYLIEFENINFSEGLFSKIPIVREKALISLNDKVNEFRCSCLFSEIPDCCTII